MKAANFITIIILALPFISYAQFKQSDVKVTVEGLSDEYTTKFKDTNNIRKFLDVLNENKIPESVKPIRIMVKYADGTGIVMAKINYDHSDVYNTHSFSRFESQWPIYGKGINTYFQDYLLQAVFTYVYSVGEERRMADGNLMALMNAVALIKSNKDYAVFYSANYQYRRGFYQPQTINNVELGVNGGKFNVQSTNAQRFDQNHYFFVGKLKGLDGKPTPNYYFCKFFEIDTE